MCRYGSVETRDCVGAVIVVLGRKSWRTKNDKIPCFGDLPLSDWEARTTHIHWTFQQGQLPGDSSQKGGAKVKIATKA